MWLNSLPWFGPFTPFSLLYTNKDITSLKLCAAASCKFQHTEKFERVTPTHRHLFLIWGRLWDSFLDKVSPWFCPERSYQPPQGLFPAGPGASSCAVLLVVLSENLRQSPSLPGVPLGGSGMWCYGCFHSRELIYSKERKKLAKTSSAVMKTLTQVDASLPGAQSSATTNTEWQNVIKI